PRRPPARLAALMVALGAALGTWLVWWAMVTTWPGQRVEERVFETADRYQDVVNHLVEPMLLLGSLPWLAAGLLVVCGIGLLRRSWVATAMAAVVILGANLTTQVIKDGVFHRVGLVGEWNQDVNTLPSGHVTVVAAAWAALLLVTPRGWRPVTALAGAAVTCAMGLATLADRWHRPSDVVAAVLVVVAWTALTCALAPAGWAGPPAAGTARRATAGTARRATAGTARRAAAGAARRADAATGPVTILLGVIAVPAAAVSVLAAAATEGYAWATLPWGGGLTAYTGGLLAACAVSAAAFAVLLPVCQAADRARSGARQAG
uniref:phosphatase PAP2 family protein n=1 Tax=Promicromonospora panici TaxID=2219658 RepID=UPI00101C28FD